MPWSRSASAAPGALRMATARSPAEATKARAPSQSARAPGRSMAASDDARHGDEQVCGVASVIGSRRPIASGSVQRIRARAPAKKASRLSSARKPMASRVSTVALPICGSRKQLGRS